jgi:hypothetical protein
MRGVVVDVDRLPAPGHRAGVSTSQGL